MQLRKEKSVNFHTYLSQRMREICEAHAHDEEGFRIKVMDAPASVLLKNREALAQRNQKLEREFFQMSRVAERQAQADPSDPFTYSRVRSHLLSGLCDASDYSVEFIRQRQSYKDADGNEIEFTQMIPTKIKRP